MIDYDEFLVGLRGHLNPKRKALVDKAFLKFDKDCSGKITIADLEGTFCVSSHPKWQSGEKTKEEILVPVAILLCN